MFAQAVPSSPTVSTTTSTVAQSSGASRPSRLRGLSYLRNYTQHHLSLHSQSSSSPSSQRDSLVRSVSYPARAGSSSQSSPSDAVHTTITASGADRVSPADRASLNSPVQAQSSSVQPTIEEESENPTDSGDQGAMVRKRASSTQAQPSRRGQSVPATSGNHDGRNGLSRTVTATEANDNATAHISGPPEPTGLTGLPQDQMPTIKFIPHQDLRSGKPSLSFAATSRTLPHEDCVIRVGRYSERDGHPNPPPHVPSSAPVGFKSKVVSRKHCEFWCSQGQWYIKDVKSSSGTFLNHIRLSQPSVESRPFPVNDGDVVQLGIDFRGGEEMIFRCVKIRIECNRSWQKGLNNFNKNTHKRLRELNKAAGKKDSDTASTHSSECAICLMSVAPCQALFVAPCSHVWHYKCIRPMLNDHKTYPQFMCPNCRAMTDLEADVDDPGEAWQDIDEDDDNDNSSLNNEPARSNGHPEEGQMELEPARGPRNVFLFGNAESTSPSPSHAPSPSTGPSLIARRLASRPRVESVDEPDGEAMDTADNDSARPDQDAWNNDEAGQSDGIATPRPIAIGSSPSSRNDALAHEGPLTPLNDAGPFVFDGSAGRAPARSEASES